MSILIKRTFAIAVAVLFVLSAIGSSNAQTKKQKPTRPEQVPTTPSTEPMVISRASDYINPNPQDPQKNTEPRQSPSEDTEATSKLIEELQDRIKALEESRKDDYDRKQKRLLLNLDILTRAEQRSESLRKQLFELIEKENSTKARLEGIDIDLRPEAIERAVSFAGSLRPEELREARKKNLSADKANLQVLLNEIAKTRTSLELNLQKSDSLVEKLRQKLEKEIDDALADDNLPEN